jgi:branched-chain amino acid transport system substrate-binding protein
VRLRFVFAALGCAVACGPPPKKASWLEVEPGQTHATPDRAVGTEEPPPVIVVSGGHALKLSGSRTDVLAAIDAASEADLAATAQTLAPSRAPVGAVAARLAALALHRGDSAGASHWLEVARAAPDHDDVAATLDAVAAQVAKTAAVDRNLIAVLLPLTGRFAPVGAELKLAIELAPADGARRVYLDTQGDPAGAAAAVDRAVAQGAVAILGPVGVREAESAARRAAERGVPIALLAPGDGADPDAGVFRLVGSPESEARAAAAMAVNVGTPTAGVLAPRDDVGIAASEAFASAAEAAGIQVTAKGLYDPTATDLEPDVKDFLGLDPAINPRLASHLRKFGKKGWQTFSPDVPFALLYIPDRHDRAAIVASFLPYLGVEVRTADFLDPDYLRKKHGGRIPQVVQLLGSSGWNHPGLVTRGGTAIEGALFVEPCPGALGDASGQEIASAYAARAGKNPSSAAQEAHDAWRLMAIARAGATVRAGDPRAAFIASLRQAKLDDGACTPSSVGEDGQLVREPALLGVEAGEITAMPY